MRFQNLPFTRIEIYRYQHVFRITSGYEMFIYILIRHVVCFTIPAICCCSWDEKESNGQHEPTHTHIKSLIFHHSAFVIVFTKFAACGENCPEKKLLFFVSFLWNVLLSFLLQEVCLYHTQTHNCCFSIFQQLLIIRHTYEMPPCYLVREELLDSFTGIRNCEKISIYILGIFELTKREKRHVFWEC